MRPVFLIEIGVFAAALAACFAMRKRRPFHVEGALGWLARLPFPPPLTAFCLTLALAGLLSAVRPPSAMVHDELSYLLAADTFASGRLANPPHPFWQHFETMHVLQQPTYQSRYPPGQGLALAAGRLLTGRYIAGTWLSMAAASAALYWALSLWLPGRWAMLGALLPILRFGSLGVWDTYEYAYWTTSFWGGAVALIGAALVFGAAPRLLRRPCTFDALLLSAGLGILAVSRPYEGLIFSAPLVCMSLVGIFRSRAWRALAAVGLALAAAASSLGYFNKQVTGSALTFPYVEYAHQYDVVRNFSLQPLHPAPEYRHDALRRYHLGYMLEGYERQRAGTGLSLSDADRNARFYLGLILTPIALLGCLWKSRWGALATALVLVGFASHTVTAIEGLRPHYFAPFVPPLILLTVQGVRLLGVFRRPYGAHVAQAVLVVVAVSFCAAASLRAFVYRPGKDLEDWKAAVAATLTPPGARHLIFVRYAPGHDIHKEWVYNAADIDASPIVWAREMSPAEDQRLRSYFHDRQAWVVFADEIPPRIATMDRINQSPQ